MKIIELDFEQNQVDFEVELLKSIGVDSICNGSNLVALPLDLETNRFRNTRKAIKIPVIFYNSCRAKDELIKLQLKYDFNLFINKEGRILINGKIMTVQKDSIVNELKGVWKNYEMNFEDFNYWKFRLIGSSNLESNLNEPIKIILESYLEFYLQKINEFCEIEYKNSIEALNISEIQQVKKHFPFTVHLSYSDNLPSFFPFPPPPPPILRND